MPIVVGYTERPESEAALARGVEEARLRNCPLHIIQTLADTVSESPERAKRWAERLQEMRQAGHSLEAQLRAEGVDSHFQLLADSASAPGSALVGIARELEADLIVIGIRRRSPVGKLVLGSVSQDVILGADCPVLAVKPSGQG